MKSMLYVLFFDNKVKNPFESPAPLGHRSLEYVMFPLKRPRPSASGALPWENPYHVMSVPHHICPSINVLLKDRIY